MVVFDIFEKFKSSSKPQGKVSKIIVGLGNPGPKYEDTKHNVGFKALDEIAADCNIDVNKQKFKALVGDGDVDGVRCLLIKPLTYMNESGVSVELARGFYKLSVDDIIVLTDDISLDPGKIRIRKKGRAGGHNGLKSIIYSTGEETFSRIKIGVGAKPSPDYDLAKWVLSNFDENQKKTMKETYERIVQAVKLMVNGKVDEAMNKYN